MPESLLTPLRTATHMGPGVELLHCAAWQTECPTVAHGLTTAWGAIPCDLRRNASISRLDAHAAQSERYRACVTLGLDPGRLCTTKQVHGNVIRVITDEGPPAYRSEGDGLVTSAPGVALGILVADCVPVFLAHRQGRAVGVAHAGWRGVLAGVVPAAVRSLGSVAGVSPADSTAWVGPGIGACCFTVGAEVWDQFARSWGSGHAALRESPYRIDLKALCAAQLKEAGVPRDQIHLASACTRCTPGFFSHRGQGPDTGRMLALIGIRP